MDGVLGCFLVAHGVFSEDAKIYSHEEQLLLAEALLQEPRVPMRLGGFLRLFQHAFGTQP